jgi:hypothetical protein
MKAEGRRDQSVIVALIRIDAREEEAEGVSLRLSAKIARLDN